MAGYTVFLGPIAGIMISDVGTDFLSLILAQVAFSTGLFTTERSTFPRSIDRKDVIGIPMAW